MPRFKINSGTPFVRRLSVSKRFEFSASHRLYNPQWSREKNVAIYGNDSRGTYGHGHNFVVFFSFEGPVDPVTGMVVELSIIKQKINAELLIHYDHFYLNDTPQFRETIPTVEAIAAALLSDAIGLFLTTPYRPISVHLIETPTSSATAYRDGVAPFPGIIHRDHHDTGTIETRQDGRSFVEVHSQFSATHRLISPTLSIDENRRCFGKCVRPHGHMFEVWATFDHKTMTLDAANAHLNTVLGPWNYGDLNELEEFKAQLVSVETIIRILWDKLAVTAPLVRLRLHETTNNRFSLRSSQ